MSKTRNNKNFEFDSGKIFRVTHIRDRNLTEGRIYPKAEFHRMPNVPKCGLNTRHDNREKWHLLIWHKRKFCALTNRPLAQSTRMGQWQSTLFYANCFAAQVYVLHPWKFIFPLSCRRDDQFCRYFFPLSAKKDILKKFFVYVMMTNVMAKTCLNPEIIKIS